MVRESQIPEVEKIRRMKLYREHNDKYIKCDLCKGVGFSTIVLSTKSFTHQRCNSCDGTGRREKTWTEIITLK